MRTFQEFLILCEGGLSRSLSKSETHDTGHISPDRGDDESENRKKRKKETCANRTEKRTLQRLYVFSENEEIFVLTGAFYSKFYAEFESDIRFV